MPFSYEIKKSLCEIQENECCKKAELYGFLLYSNTFSAEKIRIIMEHGDITNRYISFLEKFNIKKYKLTINNFHNLIIEDFDEINKLKNILNISKNIFPIFEKDCCYIAFLRGIFMTCGYIHDPKKAYGLEFLFADESLNPILFEVMNKYNLYPKKSVRKNNNMVYLKSKEQINDFLSLIGATEFMFDYINASIENDMKNDINRIVNCETANISRAVNAAVMQVNAIKKLKNNNRFESLDNKLKMVAELRLENPESNMEDLSILSFPKLSKSGVSHRLKKICEIAKSMENE